MEISQFNVQGKQNYGWSAIYFDNSKVVTFCNASFSKFFQFDVVFSRAIQAKSSSIVFESCKFVNGYHYSAGTVYFGDSNATFLGHNIFLNYTGYFGGAVLSTNSHIRFRGSGIFVGNVVGSAILIKSTNISFNGYFEFYDNRLDEISFIVFYFSGGTITALNSHLTL